MGSIALVLLFSGSNFGEVNWVSALKNFGIIGGSTFLVAYLTEEGFFRGSLFAGFNGAGFSAKKTIVITSLLFAAWHIGWATVTEEGKLPPLEAPIYLINVVLLGMSWGLMRQLSGAVLVPALSHGVWNGMAYTLFGLGTTPGFLALSDPSIYGPERGFLGMALNGAFVYYLWRKLPKT
jgi:membrane protease YdiL (CAAX protease family)